MTINDKFHLYDMNFCRLFLACKYDNFEYNDKLYFLSSINNSSKLITPSFSRF